jgi:hypothetical protein
LIEGRLALSLSASPKLIPLTKEGNLALASTQEGP